MKVKGRYQAYFVKRWGGDHENKHLRTNDLALAHNQALGLAHDGAGVIVGLIDYADFRTYDVGRVHKARCLTLAEIGDESAKADNQWNFENCAHPDYQEA